MKKAILPIFLVLIMALSISAVSADENVAIDDTLSTTDTSESVDDTLSTTDESAAVAESSKNDVVSANDPKLDTDDAKDIQNKIDGAEIGSIVTLDKSIYKVNGSNILVNKSITIDGNGATIEASGKNQSDSGATMVLSVNGITIKNIIFKNLDPILGYGNKVNGYAISANKGSENIAVDNCTFLGFNAGFQSNGIGFSNITNCYFNGSTEKVTNGGTKEFGTKAISLKGAHDLIIENCTFEGQVLDGISIASGSGNILVKNNSFINNCYAIYFGGDSTKGTIIQNNTFDKCGYAYNGTKLLFYNLPVISTQKSANSYSITNNTFIVLDGSILIKAEEENTSHGYPSKIGDINITDNEVKVADGVSLTKNTIFVNILSNEGSLTPYAPIKITDNQISGDIIPVFVQQSNWNAPDGIIIPAAEKVNTVINIKDVSTINGTITIQLIDINNKPLAGEQVSYSINGVKNPISPETDNEGLLTIDVAESAKVIFSYAGDNQLNASTADVVFTKSVNPELIKELEEIIKEKEQFISDLVNKTLKEQKDIIDNLNKTIKEQENKINQLNNQANTPTVKQTTKLTTVKKTFKRKAKTKKYSATLKTSAGKAIKNKYVEFKIGKNTYIAKTNAKGVATVSVKLSKKGKYTVKVTFIGDAEYKKVSKSAKIVVK